MIASVGPDEGPSSNVSATRGGASLGPLSVRGAGPEGADAAIERAKAAGGTVILGPMEVPGGDRVGIIIDPQGAAFGVHSKTA